MTYYDYKGVNYDIDTDDPATARAKIQAHLGEKSTGQQVKDFGKGVASLVDTAYNAIPGAVGQVAYGVGRAAGQTPEQATATTEKINQYMADPLGKAFGITQDPAYQGEAARRGMNYIGEKVGQGAEYVGQATGLPTADVANMMNTAAVAAGPVAGRAGIRGVQAATNAEMAATQAIKNAAGATAGGVRGAGEAVYGGVRDVARGAFVNEPGTNLVPVGQTHYTPASVKAYMAGEIPKEQLVVQPTSDILSSPLDRAALKVAGKQVPVQGKILEATGERLAQDYSNPLKVLTDIASTGMGIGPLFTYKRGAQALADRYLANKLQLSPDFQGKLASDKGAPAPTAPPAAPVAPEQLPLPLTSNIVPPAENFNLQSPGQMPPKPMTPAEQGANFIETQKAKWQGTPGYQGPAVDFNAPAVNPTPGAPMPKPMAPAPTTAPAVSGVQNTLAASRPDILAQIRARSGQAPLTAPGETIAGPVVPEGMSPTPAVKISTDLAELRSKIGQNINPIEQAATEAKVARGIDMSQKRLAANKPDIALRKDIKETAKGFVTKKGDNVNVDERAFNELMPEGQTIDWSQAPDVSGMSLKDARIAIRKFAFSESKKKADVNVGSMEETFAKLKGEGSWTDDAGNTVTLKKTSTGELRQQTRNKAGQVIDEKYLD